MQLIVNCHLLVLLILMYNCFRFALDKIRLFKIMQATEQC